MKLGKTEVVRPATFSSSTNTRGHIECLHSDHTDPVESDALPTNDLSARLIDLESTVAHLEHELEQMHTVLLAVQADLKIARDRIVKLEQRLVMASESPEERSPIDERPPHY